MEQKRLKGRGIEEIAHYFFSSKTDRGQDVSLFQQAESRAKVLALISLLDDLPTSFLTTNLSLELSTQQQKVLVADTACGTINIFFALGMERAFTPIECFLSGGCQEVTVTGPLGIKILTFPLDSARLSLLQSTQPNGLYRSLIREERKSHVLLINMHYPPLNHLGSALQIFSEALEVIVLASSELEGLKSCYRFMKFLYLQNQRIRFGVLLCHLAELVDPADRFALLAEAVTKFLGRKLKGYGHLANDRQLYLSLVRGKPLCRRPERDTNVQVFYEMAKTLSGKASREIPLLDLIRPSDRRPLMEVLSTPATMTMPVSFSAPLSREEEAFFALHVSGR
jgi:MinD-like ATPase involved in chromosome partitioning or flagellar assembly